MRASADDPIGVPLFNLGGPDTPADVEPFLVNLLSDREIIELPGGRWFQPIFARIIAKKRDPEVGHDYSRIGILDRLGVPDRQQLAFQSRTGPVEWIGPGTEDVLRELAAEGVKDVLVVPICFVTDHIETLYEVDMLFGDEARAAGITNSRRTDALNSDPRFIEALATPVEQHVGGR